MAPGQEGLEEQHCSAAQAQRSAARVSASLTSLMEVTHEVCTCSLPAWILFL
jgi:hypothetical protein